MRLACIRQTLYAAVQPDKPIKAAINPDKPLMAAISPDKPDSVQRKGLTANRPTLDQYRTASILMRCPPLHLVRRLLESADCKGNLRQPRGCPVISPAPLQLLLVLPKCFPLNRLPDDINRVSYPPRKAVRDC